MKMWIVALLLVTAAAPAAADDIPAAARREIEAANNGWLAAMQREDAAAIAEQYALDAVFVTADGQTVRGRDNIERLMRERFPKIGHVTGGSIHQDGLTMQGTQIFEWGHADLSLERTDGALTSRGRYLTVWRREPDGHWRITRNLSLPE
jgi:uncharacterized protein (TIGR02246 family)